MDHNIFPIHSTHMGRMKQTWNQNYNETPRLYNIIQYHRPLYLNTQLEGPVVSCRCFAIRIPFVHVSTGLSTRIKFLLQGRVPVLFGKYKTGGNGPKEWPSRNFNGADDMIFLFAHYLHFGGEKPTFHQKDSLLFCRRVKYGTAFCLFY